MKRSLVLTGSLFFLLATWTGASACRGTSAAADPDTQEDSAATRPNLLLFYVDDHAENAIGAYGSGLNRTPSIDRLAREGARFAHSFVGNSICAPARATYLTGKHSHAHGVMRNGNAFDPEQRTFPALLQAAGYQTALFGKWHLGTAPVGFDDWEVLRGQGRYYNPVLLSAAGTREVEGYTTDIVTELALGWLEEERDPERPFLLMVQHKAPHRRWLPGPDQLEFLADVDVREPATLFDDYSGRAPGAATQEMTIARHLDELDLKLVTPDFLTEEQRERWDAAYGPRNAAFAAAGLEGDALVRWKYQRYLKDYLRCIAAVDEGVGRLLDWLDGAGLAGDTLVAYTSDQGFYLGEHGWYDKRWMYEESLRTPLLVRWPERIAAGTVVEAMVQNVDLAPTFLELAGVPVPGDVHGRSLLPLLAGERPDDWRTSIYYHYYEFPGVHAVPKHHGVRTERYKLIRFEELEATELFDLRADPRELTSVADDPDYEDVRAELEAELARLRERFGDDL
jgi:arylsulfatase A-like enzyme